MPLFPARGWTRIAIQAIVILGLFAIVYYGAAALGLPIPGIVWTIAGIVLLVLLLIFAIRIIGSASGE